MGGRDEEALAQAKRVQGSFCSRPRGTRDQPLLAKQFCNTGYNKTIERSLGNCNGGILPHVGDMLGGQIDHREGGSNAFRACLKSLKERESAIL